jgi:lipopolysaccharide transport system ATP-binding protein
MSSPIIKVENLGKCYRIGHQSVKNERYTALRDIIVQNLRSAWRKTSDLVHGRQLVQGDEIEDFWALNDVNFEIEPGEVVGIIGRNGAGKSTLLKILSRITEPTRGRITLNGRVSSLLEVGTGFHPELTGRENIFLNGAILGMTRADIKAKFDEIVDFAEVASFLDTPVKRYSSGMFVRLAFAVAAHMDPEILIIDEVLAVGDADFQKKCLGKMGEVATGGRTVLFVSHNMAVISNLCQRTILLDRGTVKFSGDTASAISQYQFKANAIGSRYLPTDNAISSKAMPYFKLIDFYLTQDSGEPLIESIEARSNAQLTLHIEGLVQELDNRFNLGYALVNERGECVVMSFSTDQPESAWPAFKPNAINHVRTQIDTSILNEGVYSVYLLASIHCVKMLYTTQDDVVLQFTIFGNRGNSPYWTTKRGSTLAPAIPWNL